jgi:hypothetical protein
MGRLRALCRQPERGTLAKEAMIVVGVFFGVGAVILTPFVVLYQDRMPRGDDGRTLGARRAMGEDPVFFIVMIGATLLMITIADIVFKRLRPRLVQKETAADVAVAAQRAAETLSMSEGDHAVGRQAATSHLMDLHGKRHWPYEADRIWVTVYSSEVEVVAERTFQKPTGLLWTWGSGHRAERIDVRGRVRVAADGTVIGQDVLIFEPSA